MGAPPGACPVHVPGDEGATAIAREPLWHAYATGVDRPAPPAWAGLAEPPPPEHVPPPAPGGGARAPLPVGAVRHLQAARYPTVGGAPAVPQALGHALATAFAPLRREPANPYNDHRPYASARCLFPVQAVLADPHRARLLDPARRALVDLPGRGPGAGEEVLLTGRYAAVPRGYRWFRGSLVDLESGFALRSLALALGLHGVAGRLVLPDGQRDAGVPHALGLPAGEHWSLPLRVQVGAAAGPDPARSTARAERVDGDPVLAEVLAADRAQRSDGVPAPVHHGVPDGLAARDRTWADVLWDRTSGRMPRGLHGMAGRRRRVPRAVLDDAARWVAVPPPGTTLAVAHAELRASVAVQDVEGHGDGLHVVRDGLPVPVRPEAGLPALLERHYGYPASPVNGCDVRHASAVWFLSFRPRAVVDRIGPGGWTSALRAAGWAAHGLCLAAAAHGLYARPVRAFREEPLQSVLGLAPDETVALAVVVGTPRHADALLDLRL
ncbi:hypothetical protein D5H78_04670 [Vallicoccus soli]|uniref:Nitroreductase domain-containing protein n=1 Tax=Vallicoccus soli TaxID=2339232 RepID=A0A3A3ZNK2_9ACTN|nr:hypothetical protein D5H78_04670 [Vallicoccus soli]